MAAIGKTVKLTWGGKEYEVRVTMRLINRIEEDVNLMRLAVRLGSGDVPTSQVATVFSHLLREGGCDTTPDDVWQAMFGSDAVDIIEAATVALSCVFPEVKMPKAGGEPMGKQRATRGRKSTK